MPKPHYKKPVMVDVDDTLVMHDIQDYPELKDEIITVDFAGYKTKLIPHKKHIKLVEKFARLGYDVIIWSQTGDDWAEAIGKKLGLDRFVSAYATKPKFYFDDLKSGLWMGHRIWKEPR